MSNNASLAAKIRIGGVTATIARRDISAFRKRMLSNSNPSETERKRWETHQNTAGECKLGAYELKLRQAISHSEESRRETACSLAAAQAAKQSQEVEHAKLSIERDNLKRSMAKDIAEVLEVEAASRNFTCDVKNLTERTQNLRERVENNAYLSGKNNSAINKLWEDFSKNTIDIAGAFSGELDEADKGALNGIFLSGHPVYRFLFDIPETLEDVEKITPLASMEDSARGKSYKLPDFSKISSFEEIDEKYLVGLRCLSEDFGSLKKETTGFTRQINARVADARKYLSRRGKETDMLLKIVKSQKKPSRRDDMEINKEEMLATLQDEVKYCQQAVEMAMEMSRLVAKVFALNERYCKAANQAVTKLRRLYDIERKIDAFEFDATLAGRIEKLVFSLANGQARIESMKDAHARAKSALEAELESPKEAGRKREARRTSDENLIAYLIRLEGKEEPESKKNYYFCHSGKNMLAPEKTNVTGEAAIGGFVAKLEGEYPNMGNYPDQMENIKKTARAIAAAYVENGFRLTQTALFTALPGKVRLENTYAKLGYKPVRVVIKKKAKIRFMIDISVPEKPVIFFAGSKGECEKIMPKSSLLGAIEYAKSKPGLNDMFDSLKAHAKQEEFTF